MKGKTIKPLFNSILITKTKFQSLNIIYTSCKTQQNNYPQK